MANNRLREIRLKHDKMQKEIADELGISQESYSKLENGRVCLSIEKIEKLSEFYGVSPDYFCEMSYSCDAQKSKTIIKKIKEYFKEKGLEIPDFLK
ncbi:MAG: helix-turn-helix domain-containing protein [Flavobacteriales bacterium]